MGFFDEIKKVMFGVKAVSKSAADKVIDKGHDIVEKSDTYLEKAKDKVEDLSEGLATKAENIWDNAEDIGDKVKTKAGDLFDDARDFAESVGGKVINRADELFDDAKDLVEDIGEKVIDKAGVALEKAKEMGGHLVDKVKGNAHEGGIDNPIADTPEFSAIKSSLSTTEKSADALTEFKESNLEGIKASVGAIGHKVEDLKSDLVEKAKEIGEKLNQKLDETVKKAEDLAAHEAAQPEYKAPSEHLSKSAFADKDDFFKKAEAFAEGRYDEVRDPFSEKPKIVGKSDKSSSSKESGNPVHGFEDLDGDGNELIDDAVIDSE